MPTTPGGIVYPSATDDPDVPGDMQAMAASIEAGTAWDSSGTGFAASSGWTLSSALWKRLGSLVLIRVACTKATSAITVAAGSGNITNVAMATIPAALWPAANNPLGPGAQGRLANGFVDPTGVVTLSGVAGDGTNIAVAEIVELAGVIFLGA